MVCRCNDLDLDNIRDLMKKGFTSIDEIKRVSRLGMGPCQGRNCIPLVLGELSRFLGKPVSELDPGTYRPVVKSVSLGAVAEYDGEALTE
ncbi:MAG: (2Fe-2S)-binding protein [Clostridiales bacterium]|nr:(2Fe-2S)-binding protein [Clostridiales bacterium]